MQTEKCGFSDTAVQHRTAISLAREGKFNEAAARFAAILETDPTRLEVLHHLAQAYGDGGRLSESESAWLNLIDQAEKDRASEHSPEDNPQPAFHASTKQIADAWRQLGIIRRRMEKFPAAIEAHQKSVELDPSSTLVHIDLGVTLAKHKRRPDAKQAFLRALELDPDCYDALINLGMLLQEIGEKQEALTRLRRAVELRPDDPGGLNNLGVALSEQGNITEATECFEKLLAKHPEYVLAWNNLGNALRSAGRLPEAAAALDKALEIKPDYAEAHNNLGIIRSQMEQFDQAVRCYDRATLLRPDYPEAHANRGLVYLLLGNFHQGWSDYEWRWQGNHGLKRRNYKGKVWDGSPLAGKRILLYYEQGLGDTFQFIRYAEVLKKRGATVIFECQPILRQILDRTPGIDEFVIRGEKPPAFDFYAPLLSLPGLCQTNLDNLPRRVPYVSTDPALIWDWKRRMASVEGFRVGIVWQGNPDHKGDRNRSIPLTTFSALAAVPGVTLITLQKNFGAEQVEKLNGLFPLTDFKGIAEEGDGFLRTAAIIANLDLVISADTSVAHLSGAMGVPVWVAIQKSPDWRWLLNREDTAWYPTMRLFRQRVAGDWDEVFSRIRQALEERLSASAKTGHQPASELDTQESLTLLRKADEHIKREELPQAQELLQKSIRLDPTNANAHQDLGVVLAKQHRLREAVSCFRRALELSPDSAGVYSNLGLACLELDSLEEAVSHLRKAIWLGAGSAETHKYLGQALLGLGDGAAAEESYWAALRLRPDDVESHYNLARALLLQGKFEQGWLEYEWRLRWRNAPPRHFDRPRWLSQKLDGKRLLMIAEEDARETIQMARYADCLARQGAFVILECAPALTRLMAGCAGVSKVVCKGDSLTDYDFYVRMPSLPATFGTTLATIPAERPYLGVERPLLEAWRVQFEALKGLKIGLALDAESSNGNRDIRSSVPRCLWDRLVRLIPQCFEVTWINLQDPVVERDARITGAIPLSDVRQMFADRADTWEERAAVLRNLDLLVTADNTLAQMAGGLGVPAWVILPQGGNFRWLTARAESPWYPLMRLFRQSVRGEWEDVINRIVAALTTRLAARGPSLRD